MMPYQEFSQRFLQIAMNSRGIPLLETSKSLRRLIEPPRYDDMPPYGFELDLGPEIQGGTGKGRLVFTAIDIFNNSDLIVIAAPIGHDHPLVPGYRTREGRQEIILNSKYRNDELDRRRIKRFVAHVLPQKSEDGKSDPDNPHMYLSRPLGYNEKPDPRFELVLVTLQLPANDALSDLARRDAFRIVELLPRFLAYLQEGSIKLDDQEARQYGSLEAVMDKFYRNDGYFLKALEYRRSLNDVDKQGRIAGVYLDEYRKLELDVLKKLTRRGGKFQGILDERIALEFLRKNHGDPKGDNLRFSTHHVRGNDELHKYIFPLDAIDHDSTYFKTDIMEDAAHAFEDYDVLTMRRRGRRVEVLENEYFVASKQTEKGLPLRVDWRLLYTFHKWSKAKVRFYVKTLWGSPEDFNEAPDFLLNGIEQLHQLNSLAEVVI